MQAQQLMTSLFVKPALLDAPKSELTEGDKNEAAHVPAAKEAAAPKAPAETKEEQGREAWAAIEKPVTEASFLRWYCATHNKKPAKRVADGEAAPTAPPAKRPAAQALLPGAGAARGASAAPGGASAALLPKAKRSALLKGLGMSLKTAAKAKKWHGGSVETLTASQVMDAADFAGLFTSHPSVKMEASAGVVTSFVLSDVQLGEVFGDALKIKVPTFNRPRAFCKSFKVGDAILEMVSADGKYSRGTSSLTLKVVMRAAGGGDDGGCGGWGFDF